MRTLLFVFALVAAVFSQTVEEKCALHFDDCHACLTDPACGWCGDYCVARESNLCEMDISTQISTCPSEDAPGPIQARQSSTCFGKQCSDCLATVGCKFCEYYSSSVTIEASTCIPEDQLYTCTSSVYFPPNTQGALAGVCPQSPPAGSGVTVYFYLTGHPSPTTVQNDIALAMTTINKHNQNVPSSSIYILVYINVGNSTGKRDLNANGLDARQASSADTIVAVSGLTPNPSNYPQSDFDSDLASLAASGNVPGLTIVSAGSRPNPSTSLSTSSGTSGGSNGGHDVVSGGALAGIIIACIVFGVLVTLLIVYLIYRRDRGYAAPFRSPAASYRP